MATSNSPDSDEKKRTMRASEFLKTGSDLASKSGPNEHLQEIQAQGNQNQTPQMPKATEAISPLAPTQEQGKTRTGVVSSTIHYPAKQNSETEIPAQASQASKSPA